MDWYCNKELDDFTHSLKGKTNNNLGSVAPLATCSKLVTKELLSYVALQYYFLLNIYICNYYQFFDEKFSPRGPFSSCFRTLNMFNSMTTGQYHLM